MKYLTATKAVNHGLPCVESGMVGVAIKQKALGVGAGSGIPQKQIGIGEAFVIINKGVVEVANLITAVKGSAIYIVTATNLLTLVATGNVKFGRCVEVAGTRGTPTGMMRVDLDAKDTF